MARFQEARWEEGLDSSGVEVSEPVGAGEQHLKAKREFSSAVAIV